MKNKKLSNINLTFEEYKKVLKNLRPVDHYENYKWRETLANENKELRKANAAANNKISDININNDDDIYLIQYQSNNEKTLPKPTGKWRVASASSDIDLIRIYLGQYVHNDGDAFTQRVITLNKNLTPVEMWKNVKLDYVIEDSKAEDKDIYQLSYDVVDFNGIKLRDEIIDIDPYDLAGNY